MRFHLKRSAAIVRQICNEDLQTALRVKARLMSLAPDDSDDDICWVWHILVRRFPGTADYQYTISQIRSAWRLVRQNRRREDGLGAGNPRACARRCRGEALQRVAHESRRTRTELMRLDLEDYNAKDRTLTVAEGTYRAQIELSRTVGLAVNRWLRVRGYQQGLLFELPRLPEWREESLPEYPQAALVALNLDAASRMEEEEVLENLCQNQSPLACAFMLKNMTEKGGDWSIGVLERLEQRSNGLAGHVFTKSERRTCLRALSLRWRQVKPDADLLRAAET